MHEFFATKPRTKLHEVFSAIGAGLTTGVYQSTQSPTEFFFNHEFTNCFFVSRFCKVYLEFPTLGDRGLTKAHEFNSWAFVFIERKVIIISNDFSSYCIQNRLSFLRLTIQAILPNLSSPIRRSSLRKQ